MNNDDHCFAGTRPLAWRRGEEKQEEASLLEERPFAGRETIVHQGRTSSSYSSSSVGDEDSAERVAQIEVAKLLKSCGVRFYASLAKQYPASLIRAKVEEWRNDPDLGPGMLVRMIQGGAPIIGEVRPIERPALLSEGARGDWHRQRYERHRGRADDEEDEGVRLWRGDD